MYTHQAQKIVDEVLNDISTDRDYNEYVAMRHDILLRCCEAMASHRLADAVVDLGQAVENIQRLGLDVEAAIRGGLEVSS